ncbi:YfzA family protein [Virgibacillus ainsalahensis]
MDRLISWLKRSGLSLLGFGVLLIIIYMVDPLSWEPGWRDSAFERVDELVPDGWFVDRFAPFDSYEFNVLTALFGILVVVGIIWDLFSRVLLNDKDEDTKGEAEDEYGGHFRG